MGEAQITETNELAIELIDATGQYNRVIRIPNPLNNVTRSQVITALAAAVPSGQGDTKVGFFMDDYNPQAQLTEFGTMEIIRIQKSVQTLE